MIKPMIEILLMYLCTLMLTFVADSAKVLTPPTLWALLLIFQTAKCKYSALLGAVKSDFCLRTRFWCRKNNGAEAHTCTWGVYRYFARCSDVLSSLDRCWIKLIVFDNGTYYKVVSTRHSETSQQWFRGRLPEGVLSSRSPTGELWFPRFFSGLRLIENWFMSTQRVLIVIRCSWSNNIPRLKPDWRTASLARGLLGLLCKLFGTPLPIIVPLQQICAHFFILPCRRSNSISSCQNFITFGRKASIF